MLDVVPQDGRHEEEAEVRLVLDEVVQLLEEAEAVVARRHLSPEVLGCVRPDPDEEVGHAARLRQLGGGERRPDGELALPEDGEVGVETRLAHHAVCEKTMIAQVDQNDVELVEERAADQVVGDGLAAGRIAPRDRQLAQDGEHGGAEGGTGKAGRWKRRRVLQAQRDEVAERESDLKRREERVGEVQMTQVLKAAVRVILLSRERPNKRRKGPTLKAAELV